MMSKNLLNVILVIVAAVLAAVIYYSEETTTELELLTRIDPASISAMTIHHKKYETLFTRLEDGHWHITQPIAIAANDFRISSILKLLNAPVHKRYRSSEIDLEKIGLLEPDTMIRFDDIEITFGITNPVTSLRFVRIGEAVSTIEDVYFPLFSSHFSTLVSLNLLPVNEQPYASIKKLILLNQTISRDEAGAWQSNIDISADDINRTIEHWQHAQAFGVHQYLERKLLGEVFIYLEGTDQAITYQITDTEPWLILARPDIGLEYHLDIDAYDNLIAPQ
jgi:hypothetical protein